MTSDGPRRLGRSASINYTNERPGGTPVQRQLVSSTRPRVQDVSPTVLHTRDYARARSSGATESLRHGRLIECVADQLHGTAVRRPVSICATEFLSTSTGRATIVYDGINNWPRIGPATYCAMTQEDELRREANPQLDKHLKASPQVAESVLGTSQGGDTVRTPLGLPGETSLNEVPHPPDIHLHRSPRLSPWRDRA